MTVLDILKPIIKETGTRFHKLAKTQHKVLTLADFFSSLVRVRLQDFYKAANARSFINWAKNLPDLV